MKQIRILFIALTSCIGCNQLDSNAEGSPNQADNLVLGDDSSSVLVERASQNDLFRIQIDSLGLSINNVFVGGKIENSNITKILGEPDRIFDQYSLLVFDSLGITIMNKPDRTIIGILLSEKAKFTNLFPENLFHGVLTIHDILLDKSLNLYETGSVKFLSGSKTRIGNYSMLIEHTELQITTIDSNTVGHIKIKVPNNGYKK